MTRQKEQLKEGLKLIEAKGINLVPILNMLNYEVGIEHFLMHLGKLHDNYLNLYLRDKEDVYDKEEVREHLLIIKELKDSFLFAVAS